MHSEISMLWWDDPAWVPNTCLTMLSLVLLNKKEGEKMEKRGKKDVKTGQ